MPEGQTIEAELLSGVPLPAFVVDHNEKIEVMNAPARKLLGEGAQGRNLALAMRAPELLSAISDVLAGETARDIAVRLTDGSEYRAMVSPLSDSGRGARAMCLLTDRTRETRTENIQRDFVANVSHELRTPLTAMMGFIETLRTTARDDAAARDRFLGIMEREANRMIRLVRDLLQLSRVESEERVVPRDEVDLAALLRSAVATMRTSAEARESKLRLTGVDGSVMASGDPDQLTQVFLNLIENAIKYGGQGRDVDVTLSREETPRGWFIRIDFRDHGEGIDPVHLPRLTERFYRVDSHRSRAEGGTGLGLAIVKHIVHRHRGRLKISSERGEGSVFTVLLPEK